MTTLPAVILHNHSSFLFSKKGAAFCCNSLTTKDQEFPFRSHIAEGQWGLIVPERLKIAVCPSVLYEQETN